MSKIDWENGYYVGKEYIEDTETINVLIKYEIKVPVLFDSFDIDISREIKIRQGKGILYVNVHKTISKKLFENITNNFEAAASAHDLNAAQKYINDGNYIIGYIRSTLPLVIDEIYKRKYLEGHLLLHAIALSDIVNIAVLDIKGNGAMIIWPSPVPSFPPSKFLAMEADAVYIRDLIEAMTLYFDYNVDESIRKVITSLDNYLIYYNLNIEGKRFKDIIKYYVVENNYPFKEHNLKIVRNNIIYIYDLRNRIVHDRLRMKATQAFVAKKAIGTLSYIYQSKFMSKSHFAYILSLVDQFMGLEKQYAGTNLDEISAMHLADIPLPNADNTITNKDQFDDFMFNGLFISDKEKNLIKP